MAIPKASQALARFTVLDLTRVRSGPTCVRQLADWGANVIKIEMPPDEKGGDAPGGPREGSDFQNLHRNKRSMTLNLKSKEGRAALLKMVKKADVVVENFRPDVKRRLGIDYKDLKKVNPRIVYGSISGFGQDGPYENRPGFDQIAQGMGGLMSITGLPGQGPVRVGIPVADLTAGLFCALGIMTALLERETSKKGQHVETSLLQAQIFMLDFQAARWLINKEVPKQAGNDHPTSIPTGVFKTTDGYINIATTGGAIWRRFCNALGAEALINKPEYESAKARSDNRKVLNAEIDTYTQHKSSAEWIDLFNKAGVPCGPIYNIDQVFRRSAGQASRHRAEREEEGQVDAQCGRPAVRHVAHQEQDRRAAAGARPAHQRGAQGVRLQAQGNRRVAQSQSALIAKHFRRQP
jgi:formyl-CoA transferase